MLSLLALGSSLVWGTSDFLAGMKAKSLAPAAVVGFSQFFGLLAMTIAVLVRSPHFAAGAWPLWGVLAGLSGSSALVCFYAALSTGTMGVVAPIASLGVLVPVALGVASGESLNPLIWTGIVVAVVGVLLASGPELDGGLSRRPVLLAALAGLGFGFTLFSIDQGSAFSVIDTLWAMRLTSVTGFALAALALRRTGGVTRADLPILVIIGLADLGANALFAVATAQGYVSVASVLGSLYPVMTAVLAYLVLHERLRPVQWAGALATIAGVALIAGGG